MTDSDNRAIEIEVVLEELEKLVDDLRQGHDFTLFQQSFDRWKDRSVRFLRERVSIPEAGRFAALATRPSWMSMDDGFTPIMREHVAFLAALHEDIQRHPEHYAVPTRRSLKAAAAVRQPQVAGAPLRPPDTVTVR